MKRLLALVLAMMMLLSLCACGADKKDDTADKGGETVTTVGGETTTAQEAPTTTIEGDSTTTATEAPATTTEGAATEGTEAPATTTEGAEDPTTTTEETQAPTTTTTKAPDNRPTIKILSIGHSFSRDAMDTYMADLFKAAGWNATFGYLYYPGASLERQYHYVKDDSVSYELYNKCVDGVWIRSNGSQRASTALADEDWDIVTFQPSPDYGAGTMEAACDWGCAQKPANDYVHFDALVNNVRNQLKSYGNTDVKFYWHLTWSFASDCKLWSFDAFHKCDQKAMYWAFLTATSRHVLPNPYIEDKFIPCNTAIQNVRTSWMGDTFNAPGNYDPKGDGYHLNEKGDLVAAMTWVAFFTGKSATEFKIATKYSDEQYAAFAEAVDNAIKKPLAITESSYKTEP